MPQFCRGALKKMCQQPMTHTIASREHYLNLQAVCPLFELQYSATDSFLNPHLISVKPPNVPTLCTAMKVVTTQYACISCCSSLWAAQYFGFNDANCKVDTVQCAFANHMSWMKQNGERKNPINQPFIKVGTYFLVRNNCSTKIKEEIKTRNLCFRWYVNIIISAW